MAKKKSHKKHSHKKASVSTSRQQLQDINEVPFTEEIIEQYEQEDSSVVAVSTQKIALFLILFFIVIALALLIATFGSDDKPKTTVTSSPPSLLKVTPSDRTSANQSGTYGVQQSGGSVQPAQQLTPEQIETFQKTGNIN